MTARSLTRRDVLKGAAALGAGALVGGAPAAAKRRGRVAVVGAGAGGVAAAYFLTGTYDVDVFEARSRIGGHADSRRVTYNNNTVTVDLGAQFFHPDTHPLYVALLEETGLDRHTRAATGSLCVFPASGGEPRFTSTHPLDTLSTAVAFATFTQLARQAIISNPLPWTTTVAQWIAGLPLDQAFKDDVLHPWLTATIGCSRADADRVSARSILQTFALAFPADPATGAKTYNSKIGLKGNLQHLLDRVPAARVHRSAPVTALTKTKAGWMVRTRSSTRGPFDHIIMNAPPHTSRTLLRHLPDHRAAAALLNTYTYFDSRLVIHGDPVYMPPQRADWTAYNAAVAGRECEGSAWVGALHDPLPSGAPVDLYKSWATRRRTDPRRILAQRRFRHPLISPRTVAAARALQRHQGRGGLWFSGAYTTGADLQETALYSAMKVAERLAPHSPHLTAFRARVEARGDAGISYDL